MASADSVEFGRANHLLDESEDTPERLIDEMLKISERIAERDGRIEQVLHRMDKRFGRIQAQLQLMTHALLS